MSNLSKLLADAGIPEDLRQQIKKAEEVDISTLATALNEINDIIYAAGAPLGSERYFMIRCLAVDALRATGKYNETHGPTC